MVTALVVLASGSAVAAGGFEARAQLWLSADPSGDVTVSCAFARAPRDVQAVCDALDRLLPDRLDRISRFNEGSRLYGIGHGALTREGFALSGGVDFAPLAAVLADEGIEVLGVVARQPSSLVAVRPPSPVSFSRARGDWIEFEFPTASPPGHWAWLIGFEDRDVARIGDTLVVALLLPFLLLIAIRMLALADRRSDPATLWFRHARQSVAITLAAMLGWPVAVQALGAARLADWLVPTNLAFFHPAFVVWLYTVPPALVMLAATALGHRVSVRARGVEWTLRETLVQTALQLAAILTPITLVSLALMFVARGVYVGALSLVALGLVAAIGLGQLHRRAADLSPEALTTGPLRDRVFELAARARVQLRQIYVLSMRRARLANAFAVRGGVVLLTDVLLQNLSRREVDAVMAHEVTHLRYRHPQRLGLAFVGMIVTVMMAVAWDGERRSWPWLGLALLPAVAVLFALYRYFERIADAGAVELTGDPEAMIAALGKLGHLNRVPNEWGRWSGAFLTHPSTGWRARAIGRKAGLSDERVAELIAGASDEERYEIPATIEHAKVFSTPFKLATSARIAWMTIAVAALTPALWLAFARSTGLFAMFGWAVVLAGPVLAFCALLAVIDVAAVRPYRGLRRRLDERMRDEGIEPERLGGVFVGLAPGDEPRIYESSYDWDIGYLFLAGDRFVYLGEETRFELAPDQVDGIALGSGAPGWIPSRRVYVKWVDGGRSGTFSLRPAAVASLSHVRAAAERLSESLAAWRAGNHTASAESSLLPALGAPQIGTVTSFAPRAVATPRAAALGSVLTAVLAIIAGTLVAEGAAATLSVVAAACLAQLAMFVPLWRTPPSTAAPAPVSARRAA